MVARSYIPDRGDLVWVDFNPIRGHEERGRRPALVISTRTYHARSGMVLVCPITSKIKGYPFEVEFRTGNIRGAVLADQVRSIDWRARFVQRIAKIDSVVTREVQDKIMVLIG